MRLFVALQLSDEMRKEAASVMHEWKKRGVKGSYAPAQNLHVTLAFIGEVESAGPVKEALQQLQYKPFRLAFSDTGTYGDLLWAGIKGNQGLSGAARAVREALDAAGIPYDKKKFSPHVTMVRKMSGPWKQVKGPKGEMTVKKISLMKSAVKDGKRVYTEIFSI